MSLLTLLSRRESSPSGDGSLSDVVASTVFDLDATIAASYPGTDADYWHNLATAPADGSAQTAYDFGLGAFPGFTSTYPTHNGTQGDPAAYWSFDGGDYFVLGSGANTAFLKNIPKTTGGNDFWFAVTVRFAADNLQRLFFAGATGTDAGWMSLYMDNNEKIKLAQYNGTSSALSPNPTATIVTGATDYVIIVSHSLTSNQTTVWINSGIGEVLSHTFQTNTTDMPLLALFGETDGGTATLKNGGRVYSVAMGNEYLNNTKAAAIIAALEARHNRDYTP